MPDITLRLILGDQLSMTISSLEDIKKETDVVLICEVWNEATYVRRHKKKIAFIFSAMRHFAEELVRSGIKTHYIKLDGSENSGSFTGEVKKAVKKFRG